MPTVVAVIPAWNEEGNIGQVIAAIPREVCDIVVVVDNASTDRTAAIAAAAGAHVVAQSRRGYGHACVAGIRAALAHGAEVIVFLDGDYSDYPEEMPALVRPILADEADLVLGSRLSGNALPRGAMPPHAVFGNRLVAAMLRARFGLHITDAGPFHAIRATTLQQLELRELTYGWTVEMIAETARRGYRILEVPVSHRRRSSGESKVSGNLWASLNAAWRIVLVTARHMRRGRSKSHGSGNGK
jgi:glycosyltransferase involved in cell wall biosynthesis